MTAVTLPPGLRVGCVPYLNARPLIHAIGSPVTLMVPSALADAFSSGQLDVALVPVFEAFRHPDPQIIGSVSISADGPVRSVIVAHRGPLSEVESIAYDPASRTSSALLRVLARGPLQLRARLVAGGVGETCDRLLIGDPALEFRRALPSGWQVTDLSEAWHKWTGLPFVFAVWIVRRGLNGADAIAAAIRAATAEGLAARREIAARTADPDDAYSYLTEAIRYGLGDAEKAGLERFRRELMAIGDPVTEAWSPAWI